MGEFLRRQLADAIEILRKIGHDEMSPSRARGGVADTMLIGWALREVLGMSRDDSLFASPVLQVIERWRSLGTPTFALTEALVAALIQTDPGATRVRDLPLPLDVFCVELPMKEPLVRLPLGGDVVPIETIFVGRGTKTTETDRVVHIIETSTSKGEMMDRVDAIAIRGVWIWMYAPKFHISLFLRDEETVEDAIEHSFAESVTHGLTDEIRRTVGAAATMAVNFCFYLADMPRRAWGGDKRRLPARGPRDIVSTPVGREIQLPHELVQAARELASAGETGARWRVRASFVVRGHWRNQAVGKGRAERKRMWIQPFWKNKEGLGEMLNRRYRVDTPK